MIFYRKRKYCTMYYILCSPSLCWSKPNKRPWSISPTQRLTRTGLRISNWLFDLYSLSRTKPHHFSWKWWSQSPNPIYRTASRGERKVQISLYDWLSQRQSTLSWSWKSLSSMTCSLEILPWSLLKRSISR